MIALQNTLSQIGACIKQDFKVFLPHIMPALLKDISRDIDLKIVDADLAAKNTDTGSTSMNVKIKGMEGERQISLNTNALENKINAIGIVKNLAQNLGTGFFEYVESIAQLVASELLAYQFSRQVRKDSCKIIIYLMGAC